MKRTLGRSLKLLSILGGLFTLIVVFQNCGQPGGIAMSIEDGYDYNDDGVLVQKQQAAKTLSSSDAPPLKLVFVMDNSNSMTLNNLNLQQSITSMFDGQANNLSQFNAEMYFITTAQLPSLSGSFKNQLRSPSSLTGSATQIENNYRNPFTGEIAGDLLGFDIQTTTEPDLILKEYKAQPVVKFVDSGSKVLVEPSIRYVKGSSIDQLKAEVASRLNILAPAKASQISNAAVFPALDSESGMCALGRILRYPDNYIRPGDVTSFIVVSDENDFDASGSKCLGSESREYLYKFTCAKRVPASVTKETKVTYQTLAGAGSKRTDFTITPKDAVLNKKITTISLTKAAKNATCSATQDREFTVNFSFIEKTYVIRYSKKPKIGEREGGVPIYGTQQTNLVTGNQSGASPSDCATNVSRLRTILSDSTSELTITGCTQNADSAVPQTAQNLTYAAHTSVNLASSTTCPASVLSAVNPSGKTVGSCVMSRKTESITASALTARGFTTTSNETQCRTAIAQVCSQSSNALRDCTFVSFSASSAADSRGPKSVTQNTALSCSATCATFPGLCTTDSTQTISSFASANGFTCTASSTNSSETYTSPQSQRVVSATGTLTCSSACSQATGACGGNSNSQSIADYNKSCSSNTVDVAGTAPQNRDLGKVADATEAITCSTLCSASNGICSGSTTIAQYIQNSLGGNNCAVERLSTNVGEQVDRKEVTGVKKSELNSKTCEAGYEKEGSPVLTSSYVDSSENVSGSQTLSQYIISRLASIVGRQAATLSAFITPSGGASGSTSYGQLYEQLVNSWGQGTVQDIRSPSYAPALTQLSQVLRSQLLRSISFPEVKATQRVRSVWKMSGNGTDWGSPLAADQWSATGGTVTLAASVSLDVDDQIRIEFY